MSADPYSTFNVQHSAWITPPHRLSAPNVMLDAPCPCALFFILVVFLVSHALVLAFRPACTARLAPHFIATPLISETGTLCSYGVRASPICVLPPTVTLRAPLPARLPNLYASAPAPAPAGTPDPDTMSEIFLRIQRNQSCRFRGKTV